MLKRPFYAERGKDSVTGAIIEGKGKKEKKGQTTLTK